MKEKRIASVTVTLILLILPPVAHAQETFKIFSIEDIQTEFNSVPCKDEDRFEAVKTLFEKFGVSSDELSTEKFTHVDNLVVRKQGESEEVVVIGAHYDKMGGGCGAIDNWSGIVALAHLYATLRDALIKKTILFVAFGKEEKGLIGSRAMANAIAKDQRKQYCAMLNIDSLGLAAPQALGNASSKKLRELAAKTAGEMKIPFDSATVTGADSDSSAFLRVRIPAVTIHGLSDKWRSILHGPNDQLSKVNPDSVYLGYRLVLAMLVQIDAAPCDAFR